MEKEQWSAFFSNPELYVLVYMKQQKRGEKKKSPCKSSGKTF